VFENSQWIGSSHVLANVGPVGSAAEMSGDGNSPVILIDIHDHRFMTAIGIEGPECFARRSRTIPENLISCSSTKITDNRNRSVRHRSLYPLEPLEPFVTKIAQQHVRRRIRTMHEHVQRIRPARELTHDRMPMPTRIAGRTG
jgi:hypothetical protein